MTEERRIDEQVVSQAMKARLEDQLENAQAIDVEVRTNPIKALLGELDKLAVHGEGVVMRDLRVETLDMQTDHISINPLSALLGKVELDQPLDTTLRLTLTESDLNRAMRSELLARALPPLKMTVAGEPASAELQFPMSIQLPGDEQMQLEGSALLRQPNGTRSVSFSVVMVPSKGDRPLTLKAFECPDGASLELAIGLLDAFQRLLKQPYLEWQEIAFRIKTLEVHTGSLTLETEAHLRRMPELEE